MKLDIQETSDTKEDFDVIVERKMFETDFGEEMLQMGMVKTKKHRSRLRKFESPRAQEKTRLYEW